MKEFPKSSGGAMNPSELCLCVRPLKGKAERPQFIFLSYLVDSRTAAAVVRETRGQPVMQGTRANAKTAEAQTFAYRTSEGDAFTARWSQQDVVAGQKRLPGVSLKVGQPIPGAPAGSPVYSGSTATLIGVTPAPTQTKNLVKARAGDTRFDLYQPKAGDDVVLERSHPFFAPILGVHLTPFYWTSISLGQYDVVYNNDDRPASKG